MRKVRELTGEASQALNGLKELIQRSIMLHTIKHPPVHIEFGIRWTVLDEAIIYISGKYSYTGEEIFNFGQAIDDEVLRRHGGTIGEVTTITARVLVQSVMEQMIAGFIKFKVRESEAKFRRKCNEKEEKELVENIDYGL